MKIIEELPEGGSFFGAGYGEIEDELREGTLLPHWEDEDIHTVIDPINREGLRNKQMLEDIINLRTQLAIKHEIGQQEEAVLTDTQRS